MLTESCLGCDTDVPLSGAVHILVNPKGDADVADGYLCRSCFADHVEPLLPDESGEVGAEDGTDESVDDGDQVDDADDSVEGEDHTGDRDDRPLEEA